MAAPLKLERVVRVDDDTWRPFNMASFDQDKVRTFGDFQYTPYWDADKTLVVARRDLRDNSVQTVRLEGRTLTINPRDGHRNTVVGVSEQDGRLHLSWDHHCNQLRYGTSRPGFITNPPETISADDFEPPRPLIPDNKLESTATYPRFLSNPPEALHFIYRQGGSGNGDNYVHRYDAATHTWKRIGEAGLFSRRGTYAPWQNSTSRCAYLNDTLLDTNGRLHVTWCYRETGATWASNHDLHYAYSDDSGATWRNNAGRLIADLPKGDSIELDDPGIVVKEIPVFSWLMNQCTMTLDADNQPHVVNFHLATPEKPKGKLEHSPPREISSKLQLFHYWRTPDGKWHDSGPVTHLTTRPGIVFDRAGNLIVYYAKNAKIQVHVALKATDWREWQHASIEIPGIDLRTASKPDLGRMKRDGILSFAVTTNEPEGKRGFALVDFKLTPGTRAEVPEEEQKPKRHGKSKARASARPASSKSQPQASGTPKDKKDKSLMIITINHGATTTTNQTDDDDNDDSDDSATRTYGGSTISWCGWGTRVVNTSDPLRQVGLTPTNDETTTDEDDDNGSDWVWLIPTQFKTYVTITQRIYQDIVDPRTLPPSSNGPQVPSCP
jgi:hypothetical protein